MKVPSLVRAYIVWGMMLTAIAAASPAALAIRGGDLAIFGPVGITRGQVLRVNVSGIGNPNDLPWTFHIRVLDVNGAVVSERRLQLRPGTTGVLDVTVAERRGGGPASRQTLRAEVVGFNPQPDPPSAWVTTVEVIDASTGRTTILLGGPDTVPGQS